MASPPGCTLMPRDTASESLLCAGVLAKHNKGLEFIPHSVVRNTCRSWQTSSIHTSWAVVPIPTGFQWILEGSILHYFVPPNTVAPHMSALQ